MVLNQPPSGRAEDLSEFFPQLCRYAFSYSHRLGCLHPELCSLDAVTDCLMSESANETGRVKILGDQIIINYPNARDNRKVLSTFVKLKVRSKHSRCKECKHAKDFCEFVEDYSDAEERGPRASHPGSPSPMTPEEIYRRKELLKRILEAIPSPEQRQALKYRIMGYSFEEIGRMQHKNPATVRQWFVRIRQKINRLL
jgi:hypothetical protein